MSLDYVSVNCRSVSRYYSLNVRVCVATYTSWIYAGVCVCAWIAFFGVLRTTQRGIYYTFAMFSAFLLMILNKWYWRITFVVTFTLPTPVSGCEPVHFLLCVFCFFLRVGGKSESDNESSGGGWGFVAENSEHLAWLAKCDMSFGGVGFWTTDAAEVVHASFIMNSFLYFCCMLV